jgi:hypothetical protein
MRRRDFLSLVGGATAWPFAVSDARDVAEAPAPLVQNERDELDLPRIPWEGGSAYYAQFSNAKAHGWASPNFFLIGVFLGPTQAPYPLRLKGTGINCYVAVEPNSQLSLVTNAGVDVMPQMDEWTTAQVGTDPRAVAWFVADEPDMNTDAGGEDERLATVRGLVAQMRGYNDGRFASCNIGNGVCRTRWCPNTIDKIVQAVDACCVDQYAYTAPVVRRNLTASPDWPAGVANAKVCASYGWLADQMFRFQDSNARKPFYVAVETARPLRTEIGATTITTAQIAGAVWSAIRHEARGIMYFQHNNDPALRNSFYSIADNPTIRAAVTAINAKIASLAPVLNTQSYRYNFNNGTDTMLKVKDAFAYIFAGIGFNQATGTKTFTLPPGVNGNSVGVVGENRTLAVDARAFSDSFANEYTNHVYEISMA